MKLLNKLLKKSKLKKKNIPEIGYIIEVSHTYIVTLGMDDEGKNIMVGYTDDAEAAAFAIGYHCRLQELAGDKYAVCLKPDRSMVSYLVMANKHEENVQKILKARNDGEKKAEQDATLYV